jgi:hypothetical protein
MFRPLYRVITRRTVQSVKHAYQTTPPLLQLLNNSQHPPSPTPFRPTLHKYTRTHTDIPQTAVQTELLQHNDSITTGKRPHACTIKPDTHNYYIK